MFFRVFLILLGSSFAFVAAARPALATSWAQILDCDHGGLVIKVNPDERRQLQMVIRNRDAQKWLYGGYAYGQCGLEKTRPCYNAQGGLEIAGGNSRGVFKPSDFYYMRAYGGYNMPGALEMDFIAKREAHGIRVLTISDSKQEVDCGTTGEGPCESYSVPIPYQEFGNWFFNDCRQVWASF